MFAAYIQQHSLLRTIHHRFFKYLVKFKDRLYSFTYSNKNKVSIYSYDPKSQAIAKSIKKLILDKYPHLTIHHVGSTSLKIAGVKDIDLIIEYPKRKFKNIVTGLISLFGKPTKRRESNIEWKFVQDNFNVEIVLTDSQSPIFKRNLNIHNILLHNSTYRAQYNALKLRLNGSSIRTYDKEKSNFLKSIPEYWNF